MLSPGCLNEHAIREKLSKLLKIDLEKHEIVHLRPITLGASNLSHAEMSDEDREAMFLNETVWFPPVGVAPPAAASTKKKDATVDSDAAATSTSTTPSPEPDDNRENVTSNETESIPPETSHSATVSATTTDETSTTPTDETRTTTTDTAQSSEVDGGGENIRFNETAVAPVMTTTTRSTTTAAVGRHTGEYLARITLRGGYTVPLRIEVLPR